MKTKYALVLSGGGFNGAFQLGALKYINSNWSRICDHPTASMKFDIVAGVSTGALNGALVSMNQFAQLEKIWVERIAKGGTSEVYNSAFIDTHSTEDNLKFKLDLQQLKKMFKFQIDLDLSLIDKIGMIFSKSKRKEVLNQFIESAKASVMKQVHSFRSVADNSPLREKLHEYLDRSKIHETKFICGFVSLNSGIYHSVMHNDFCSDTDFINGVLSSTAMPVVWNPVEKVSFYEQGTVKEAYHNVDGGLMNVSPLGDVINQISQDEEDCKYKIIIINCNSGVPKYQDFSQKSIGGIASRSIYDLALTEIFRNDLSNFLTLNDVVKQVKDVMPGMNLYNAQRKPIRAFDAVVISPDKDFDLGNPLIANENLISKRIDHGFRQARLTFNP